MKKSAMVHIYYSLSVIGALSALEKSVVNATGSMMYFLFDAAIMILNFVDPTDSLP